MNSQRLFIAIDLPDNIAESCYCPRPALSRSVFSPPSQIHLTLAFFAAVIAITADLLRGKTRGYLVSRIFPACRRTGKLFKKSNTPHVLWVGVGHAHPHLFRLHKRVNEAALACNLPIEERAWTPHFTIARARGISTALMQSFLKKHRDYDAGMMYVAEFHLYESDFNAGRSHPSARAHVTAR